MLARFNQLRLFCYVRQAIFWRRVLECLQQPIHNGQSFRGTMASLSTQCLILGAGAAGLHCAGKLMLGNKGSAPKSIIVDHAARPAEKVRISGGGRCNFTNLSIDPKRFLSANPHFCKSALKRYTQWDFVNEVADRGIAFHEKTLGQLFCDDRSQQIIDMLLDAASAAGAAIWLKTKVREVRALPTGGFQVLLVREGKDITVLAENLVVASGGLSIPKIGASGLGYKIAEQFGHSVHTTRPGLVPLTFSGDLLQQAKHLAGLSTPTSVAIDCIAFDDGLLFTHRGLSGPSILQISSYWRENTAIRVNLAPGQSIGKRLIEHREIAAKKRVKSVLADTLPLRLAQAICHELGINGTLADTNNKALYALGERVNNWHIVPTGTEGYRTAEVTLGGVDTSKLSSQSMESAHMPGLYFIGETVDVTGWLGGYNFQWAWSSGWAAAQAISVKQTGN